MKIYVPPMSIASSYVYKNRIFLAGSIEMGKAMDWQSYVTSGRLNEKKDVCFYNPRRKDWDSSWIQKFENPQFFQQVSWELEALDKATHIIVFLQEGTISPISLLELGLHAKDENVYVVCQEGFERKGNVDIVCMKYEIPTFGSIDECISHLLKTII